MQQISSISIQYYIPNFGTVFSRDSDLTSSPRDEDMLEKDVDMCKL